MLPANSLVSLAIFLVFHLFSTLVRGQEYAPHAQDYAHRFEHFDVDDGLSQSAIVCLFQDSRGYLWIGTRDGLNRYDGYSFKVYKNLSEDSTSISGNIVSAIAEDTARRCLWIGTSRGLNRFDIANERFERFRFNKNDPASLGSDAINSLYVDKQSTLWVGTSDAGDGKGGLVEYRHEENLFRRYDVNFNGHSANYVRTITADKFGKLWLGTGNGVFVFDPEKNKLAIAFHNDPTDTNTIGNNNIAGILNDSRGVMWVARWGSPFGGLSKIQILNDRYEVRIKNYFQDLQKVIRDENSILDNNLTDIIESKDGRIWMGTGWGISIMDPFTETFTNIKVNPRNPSTIQESGITTLLRDRSGVIWIGYNSMGLGKLVSNKGFVNIPSSPNQKTSFTSGFVYCMYEDDDGILWIGTRDGGLNRVRFHDGYNGKYSTVTYRDDYGNKFIFPSISSIVRLGNNKLCIGTTGGGVYRFDSKSETAEGFEVDPSGEMSLDAMDVRTVHRDSRQTFWVGTRAGVYRIDGIQSQAHPKFTKISFKDKSGKIRSPGRVDNILDDNQKVLHSFSSHEGIFYLDDKEQQFQMLHEFTDQGIYSALFSKAGHLWVGTQKGLHKFEQIKDDRSYSLRTLQVFTSTNSSLANDAIYEVLEDIHGNIWVSHNKGLSVLNIDAGKFKNYGYEDGLQSNEFTVNAGTNLSNGYLSFGGLKGLNIFHPDSLKDNSNVPQITITDFRLRNEESGTIKPDYEVKYFENVMTFEFAALDFTAPSINQYAYQMVGFDPDWVYSGNRRFATYTNLDPGTYTFRVKGSNNDDLWNEAFTSIKIVILPPPWRTWWAYSLYGAAFVFILWFARNEIIKRERLRNEFQLKKVEADKYHELDTMKSRFFANISHEFRTPLTLILGPIQKRLMLAEGTEDSTELSMIQRNAQRLLKLVNQLLDLSKLEAGTMRLKCSSSDLVAFSRLLVQGFHSMAEAKGIKYTFESNVDRLDVFFDKEKLEKIMINLLSNAFKFTPAGSEVTVSISSSTENDKAFPEGFAEIRVCDTGIGISSQHLEKIFDRFYQVDSSQTREYEGTGIGLALTKELVDLHLGKITAECSPKHGTIFTVRLPLGSSHLQALEIQERTSPELSAYNSWVSSPLDAKVSDVLNGQTETVMIVEDNADLRHYLLENLRPQYHVLEASNGEDGLTLAFEKIPDLVISDLMMPRMDGMQLTQRLKNDERTSHIPVVLLTAKAESEPRIQGLELGADDYIPKPFEMKELLVRVRNLITGRKKLREKYSIQIAIQAKKVTAPSVEERFLLKALDVVEKNIENTGFGVELFAREAGMSATQLYRKLTALTGYSPNDFIRHLRLQRAADLLSQQTGNVSEIAYSTGFNNLSYFSKCFKDKFGVSPSDYTSKKLPTTENGSGMIKDMQ